jgi:hypothetical protein
MMSALQTVTLKRVKDGKSETFGLQHALNLLRMQKGRVQWILSDDKYKFEKNEIIRKPSKGADKES